MTGSNNHNSHHNHGFTRSANSTPVVFTPIGRSAFADQFAEPQDEQYLNNRDLIQEEEELLEDCHVPTTQIQYRSYGTLDHRTLLESPNNHNYNDNTSEQATLVSKTWNYAVEHGAVHTSIKRELFYQFKASVPLTCTFLLQYSLPVASVFCVGHLGKIELGAVSLASMTANITGFALIQGLATCMDTLCAQAYGANLYHQVGEYLQKCCLMILVCFVPVSVLWYYSAPVLLLFVDDTQLVDLAVSYLRVVSAGIPAYILFECLKRYLQAQNIFHASTAVLAVCAPINAVLNYVLVWDSRIGMGFVGAPLAVAITTWLMAAMLCLYIFFIDGSKCWGGFSDRLFDRWNVMFQLAIPGVIMVEAEFLAFEFLTLASSRFGTTALAAQSVISTTLGLLYQIPFAIGIAASTRIANFVGASLASSAKTSTNVALSLAVFISLLDSFIVYYFRYTIGHSFSNDPDVVDLVVRLVPIIAFCHFFDVPTAILAGILRGMGRQRIGGYLNLFIYYVFALPLSFYLAFSRNLELLGLWLGIGSALVTISLCEAFYVFYCDWNDIILEFETRQEDFEGV